MDFDNNIPIYIQLVDKLKIYIFLIKLKLVNDCLLLENWLCS